MGFCTQIMEESKELEILGDGKQKKEYFYVKDCVDGILTGYRKSSNRVNKYNLAIEKLTTVDEVANIVFEEMGLKNVAKR